MKKQNALRLTQAAMIAAIYVVLTYQRLWIGEWCHSGANLRSTDDSAHFYTGSDSGSVCGMSAEQHFDGMYGTGCGVWQSGNSAGGHWHISVA